jgi:hypothetical protein
MDGAPSLARLLDCKAKSGHSPQKSADGEPRFRNCRTMMKFGGIAAFVASTLSALFELHRIDLALIGRAILVVDRHDIERLAIGTEGEIG